MCSEKGCNCSIAKLIREWQICQRSNRDSISFSIVVLDDVAGVDLEILMITAGSRRGPTVLVATAAAEDSSKRRSALARTFSTIVSMFFADLSIGGGACTLLGVGGRVSGHRGRGDRDRRDVRSR